VTYYLPSGFKVRNDLARCRLKLSEKIIRLVERKVNSNRGRISNTQQLTVVRWHSRDMSKVGSNTNPGRDTVLYSFLAKSANGVIE